MAGVIQNLTKQLNQGLKPVYLVHGEEPQQANEALDCIRAVAKQVGFVERTVLFAESSFNWHELRSSCETLSLFSQKKIIDLRLAGSQPNKAGAAILEQYLNKPSADIVLLMSTEKLGKAAPKSAWYKLIAAKGFVQQCRVLTGKNLMDWLAERAQQRGLQMDQESLRSLLLRVEGNMLAAAQEIDKLYQEFGATQISAEQVELWVADQSRHTVFDWVDSMMAGHVVRSQRILQGLQAEGVAPALVLWSVAREIRILAKLSKAGSINSSSLQRMGVWGKRAQAMQRAAQRLDNARISDLLLAVNYADQALKGRQATNVWQCLHELAVAIAIAPQQLVSIALRDRLALSSPH